MEALGIITVSIPDIKPIRTNIINDVLISNAHANSNFQLYREEQENKICGFSISPLVGKKLVESCIDLRSEGKTPTASIKVCAILEPGFIENVEAVIPGETSEEILMVFNLYQPKSSVNDNASGVGAAMEAICTLSRLILQGILQRQKDNKITIST